MSTYKITRVSEQPPNAWPKDAPTTWYYKLMVEGHERPISVGKKKPDFVFRVGDTIDGTITADPGRDADKFKADATAFGGGGSRPAVPRGTTPEDKESIARAVALKAAVDFERVDVAGAKDVLQTADIFLAWLKGETVKYSGDDSEPTYVDSLDDQIDKGF